MQFRAYKIIYFFSNLTLPKKMRFTAILESSSSASKPNCSGAITSKHSSPSRAVATDFFVFVDNSNVYLGAQHMDGKMNHAVRLDIDRLVKQIEQERFCVVRHVCGSNEKQPVWAKWRTNKYDVHIAQQKAGKEEGVDASLHSVIYRLQHHHATGHPHVQEEPVCHRLCDGRRQHTLSIHVVVPADRKDSCRSGLASRGAVMAGLAVQGMDQAA